MSIKEVKTFCDICKKLKLKTAGEIIDYVIAKRNEGKVIDKIFDHTMRVGG